jgi:hypothetical protein
MLAAAVIVSARCNLEVVTFSESKAHVRQLVLHWRCARHVPRSHRELRSRRGSAQVENAGDLAGSIRTDKRPAGSAGWRALCFRTDRVGYADRQKLVGFRDRR